MRREGTPTRRRVVAACTALALALLLAVVGLTEVLRHDTRAPARSGPPDEAAFDPLREVVECPPAAEGDRAGPAATSGSAAAAPKVSSAELYDCPASWDGRTVRFAGEVVGAVLHRGDHAWVQLNDDVYAGGVGPLPAHRDFAGGNAGVGAHLDAVEAARISTVGGPAVRGDQVEVVATFHRVDESSELAVLEVTSLRVVRPGQPVPLPPASGRAVVAMVAALAALVVVVVERRRRSRR